jgi:sugar-specific transcriptional regulator TrmB
MSELENSRLENLQKLGLTLLQAKIYTIVLDAGKEKILTISKIANVDRSNTYRTILHLQNMGLVEKTLGSPNIYQAIPIRDAVLTLINSKKDEYDKMQKVATKLMQTGLMNDTGFPEKEYEFKIIKKGKKAEIKFIIDSCKDIRESFDLLINKKTFCGGVIDLAKEQLTCVRRGIKYRMVTEKINSKEIQKKLALFMSEPNFQIRYITKAPEAELAIDDKKVAHVVLAPNSGLGERSMLFTNHPGCVEMFQNHFDKIWNEAEEYKFESNQATAQKIVNK